MKFIISLFFLLLMGYSSAVSMLTLSESAESSTLSDQAKLQLLEESSQVRLEQQLLYRQIYSMAFDNIDLQVDEGNLKPKTWAVIFSYSSLMQEHYLRAQPESNIIPDYSYPGARNIVCRIEKLGGRVVVVSNYVESAGFSQIAQLHLTESDLSQQKICYSSIIVANESDATNKNPRFTAISSGDYENVLTSAKLPPLKIIAYFGTAFEDFPDFKTNTAVTTPVNSSRFDLFGDGYYLLPTLEYKH